MMVFNIFGVNRMPHTHLYVTTMCTTDKMQCPKFTSSLMLTSAHVQRGSWTTAIWQL